MNSSNQNAVGMVFAGMLFLGATGILPTDVPRSRPAMFTKYERNDKLNAAQKKLVADQCLAGMPKRREGAPHGPTRYVLRKAYVLETSLELRMPLWVCEKLTDKDVVGKEERSKAKFRADPDLLRFPHTREDDIPKTGFVQGHMAPDKNRQDPDMKAETFFLSNIVAQAGNTQIRKNFNSGIWLSLENKVREWTKARKECWIITGAFLHEPAEEAESTADGLVDYFVVGKSPVAVPTHLFKIVVAKNANKDWESLAFVFENRSYKPKSPPKNRKIDPNEPESDPKLYLKSIQFIEERTGFDFFPNPEIDFDPKLLRTVTATDLWETPK